MPVILGQPPTKRCKQCEDPNGSRSESTHSWSLQLDQDLLDTIAAIYPEWFKGYADNRAAMSEGHPPPTSPAPNTSQAVVPKPKTDIDASPLHTTMDKNKESLKKKLMMRRPINQLVAQGIIPSLKTPPAFHEQRQKLERAKTGDLLKAKIQKRPDRDELIRQHILEADMGHVDPSLAEKQRMLKKARLADSLNDQLSHRPGPLELIQKNILHTEEPIERAVKEGVIPFKATSEGLRKAHHPDHYVTYEEDSQSSDNSQNSLPTLEPCMLKPRNVIETAATNAGIVTVAVLQPLPAELCSPLSLGSSTSSLSPLSSVASPPTPLTPRPSSLASPAPGKADKNRKKSKTKAQPKTRTIKFHEYKGPPSAQKTLNLNNNSNETSYELLLQQQQLFLQWQLEWQHKYPQIILPASQKPSNDVPTTTLVVTTTTSPVAAAAAAAVGTPTATIAPVQPQTQQAMPSMVSPASPPQSTATVTSSTDPPPKYEEMKVSDLKEELKRRNLPVSGAKPQLIERLRGNVSSSTDSIDMEGCEMDEAKLSTTSTPPPPPSPTPSFMDTTEQSPPSSPVGETIIQQQQRKIEELQRELQRSQQQLLKIQRKDQQPTPIPLKAVLQNGVIHIDPKKLLLQQHVQSKMQQATQTANVNVKASLAARITQHQAQQQINQLLKNKILVPVEVKKAPMPPPPVYEEATKNIKQQEQGTKNVKSEIVDDLLDILIKSGELPPSAAQDPTTPPTVSKTSVTPQQPPAFPEPAPYPAPYIENMATDFTEMTNNNTTADHFHSNLDFLLNQDLYTSNGNNGNVSLKDIGFDLETLDSMDFGQIEEAGNNNSDLPVAMDMDESWLNFVNPTTTTASDLRLYDPLLGTAQQPYDMFNLEENDLKLSAMSWDKVDFAT